MLCMRSSPTPVAGPSSLTVLGKRKAATGRAQRDTIPCVPTYHLQVTSSDAGRDLGASGPEESRPEIYTHDIPEDSQLQRQWLPVSEANRAIGTPLAAQHTQGCATGLKKKPYACTWEDCHKAYAKPSRLAEHTRSHTGDRPFECEECGKLFLRKVHLQAHARQHADQTKRPLACTVVGACGKRFWTSQQLKQHEEMHKGEKPYQCHENGCEAGFAKNSQLRRHVVEMHCPPGTKPFRCLHDGCTKSCTTKQQLDSHSKTHEDRYTCHEPSCVTIEDDGTTAPTYFRTWTLLLTHLRQIHPPTCPYPECKGKTFSKAHLLKTHLRTHGERQSDDDMDESESNEEIDIIGEDSDEYVGRGATREASTSLSSKRRRVAVDERVFRCTEPNCSKALKTAQSLQSHHKIAHLGQLDFFCSNTGCSKRFGYKQNLKAHLRACKPKPPATASTINSLGQSSSTSSLIDQLTGTAYKDEARKNKRVLTCPWLSLGNKNVGQDTQLSQQCCAHVFGRMYDLRRHLKSAHGLETDNLTLADLMISYSNYQ
ncbi:Strongly-conserved Zn-finger binding protein (TFIIIA) [Tulasnella sp. JGI-2019a]|nr:Strongly-conserved Zn-finger binding protein (TFIIIA) [Tulasnella sp. JGI-2019a]